MLIAGLDAGCRSGEPISTLRPGTLTVAVTTAAPASSYDPQFWIRRYIERFANEHGLVAAWVVVPFDRSWLLAGRDEGYIEGTRHLPYRIVRKCLDDLPEDRPIITICSSGARASIAASVIAAAGKEVRPVLGGGVEDWADRGGATVQFRRCGS